MFDIKIDNNKLKEDTKEYFNIFYMNLLFSDTDTMDMEFKDSILHEDGKLLLVAEKTISHVDTFDELRSRGKRNRLNNKKVVEDIYIDYDYLMELGNSNELDLNYVDSDQDGTNIKYELSWTNKEKFTKVFVKTNVNWIPEKKNV